MRFLPLVLATQLACESPDTPDAAIEDAGVGDLGYVIDTGIPPFDAGDPEGTHASLACERDEHCGDGPNLFCNLMVQRGACTADCQDSFDPASEEMQCDGPGATCVSPVQGGIGICAKACAPRTDDCPANMACTGFWYNRAVIDTPGCWPFCSEGDHCPDGRCNPRIGACGFEEDLALRADGEPCDLRMIDECRGLCFLVFTTTTTGVCGSFINLARDPACRDFPDRTVIFNAPREDIGICAYRTCSASSECTAPLSCKPIEGQLVCAP